MLHACILVEGSEKLKISIRSIDNMDNKNNSTQT